MSFISLIFSNILLQSSQNRNTFDTNLKSSPTIILLHRFCSYVIHTCYIIIRNIYIQFMWSMHLSLSESQWNFINLSRLSLIFVFSIVSIRHVLYQYRMWFIVQIPHHHFALFVSKLSKFGWHFNFFRKFFFYFTVSTLH